MMTLPRLARAQWLIIILLGGLLALWLWLALSFWAQYRAYHQESYDLVPRIARLKGLAASEDSLREANNLVAQEVADLAYPMTLDLAATGAQLQQQVRAALEATGMSVAGSQILQPQVDRLFTRIQLEVSASGSMESLETSLLALGELRPVVIVDAVNLQPLRSRRRGDEGQMIILKLRLTALRLTP